MLSRAVFLAVPTVASRDLPTAVCLAVRLALRTAACLAVRQARVVSPAVRLLASLAVPTSALTWLASSVVSFRARARLLLRPLSRLPATAVFLDRASSTSSPSFPTLTRTSFTTQ